MFLGIFVLKFIEIPSNSIWFHLKPTFFSPEIDSSYPKTLISQVSLRFDPKNTQFNILAPWELNPMTHLWVKKVEYLLLVVSKIWFHPFVELFELNPLIPKFSSGHHRKCSKMVVQKTKTEFSRTGSSKSIDLKICVGRF